MNSLRPSLPAPRYIVALSLCLCALLAAEAGAEVVESEVGGPIAVTDDNTGQPYPDFANLEGADGEIVDVDVAMRITHDKPIDLDILLESPEGHRVVVLSDSCGTGDLANADFIFDQDAASATPGNGPCPDGSTFRPFNAIADDSWTGVVGVNPANLDHFNGGDPNGLWRLRVKGDGAPSSGTIASWKVRVTTTRSEIVIPNTGTVGAADPYPSPKTFEVPPGQVIDDVDLLVDDFNHLHPDDVDILLQGPGGATTLLMSDACEDDDVHDRTWTFDDEAPTTMSDLSSAGCGAGAVRPSALGGIDIFGAPAPPAPYGAQLSAYDGLSGGEWSLFVVDDSSGDTGFLGGWSAQLTTRPAAATSFTDDSVQGREGSTVSLTVNRSGPAELGPARLDVALAPGSAGADDVGALPSTLEFARGEASRTLEVPIADDPAAERAPETLGVVLSSPRDDAALGGASTATVAIAPSDRNDFVLGKSQGRRNGSVELSVKVPGPGELRATGKKIERAQATARARGKVELVVKPSKQAMKQLRKGKKVKAKADVTFTPTGGTAATKSVKVVLKRKAGR